MAWPAVAYVGQCSRLWAVYMQFRLFAAMVVFVGSYLPLAIILAVQDIPFSWWSRSICDFSKVSSCDFIPFDHPWLSISFIVFSALSSILAFVSLGKLTYPYQIEVVSFKSISNDIINYVFPYVVSFMGMSYSHPEKLLGFVVFLSWMFAITYKSGQIIMNPLLLMFGWRLYEVNILYGGHEKVVRALKRGGLQPGLQMSQTVQDFYIVRG